MSAPDRLAGPGALGYRIGTYATFVATMEHAAQGNPPLSPQSLQSEGDFARALIGGWAEVCDVLTFYQERIANEGFLPTATEPLSIGLLAAQTGQQRKPALGARTSLAIRLIDAAGQPPSLTVTAGPALAVQNAPASPGVLPAIFECAEQCELRAGWNELAVVVAPVIAPPTVRVGCRSLRLSGTALGVRPGSALVLHTAGALSWMVIADTVLADRTRGFTLVTWRDPLPAFDAKSPPTVTAVTLFTRSAGLFGRTAMAWGDVDAKRRQAIGTSPGGVLTLDLGGLTPDHQVSGQALWVRPAAATASPENIQALLGLDGDRLLAGTGRGLFRSNDAGATWYALALPQPNGWHDVLSLHRDAQGALYAGTAAGVVLTSGDGGNGWAMLPQSVYPPPPSAASHKGGRFSGVFSPVHETSAPPQPWTLLSPIRAVVTQLPDAGRAASVFIGTDRGVFAMSGNTPGWIQFVLPGVPVAALAIVADGGSGKGKLLLIATGSGLFSVALASGSEPSAPVGAATILKGVECTSMLAVGSGGLVVGTPSGFLLWNLAGGEWHAFNRGLGAAPPAVGSLVRLGGSICAVTSSGIFMRDIAGQAGGDAPGWTPLDTQLLTLFELDRVFAAGLDAGKLLPALVERFARAGIALATYLSVRTIYLPVATFGERAGWELFDPGQPLYPAYRIYAGAPLRVARFIRNPADLDARLAVTGNLALVAALTSGPVVDDQWPDFAIPTGETSGDPGVEGAELFLDRRIDGLETGGSLVLAPGGGSVTINPHVRAVIASETILHKAFGKQGIVSRVVVEPTAELLATDLRTTQVHLANRSLTPFTAIDPGVDPVGGSTLTLPGAHGDLARGRSLQVTGSRPGAVIVEPTTVGLLTPLVPAPLGYVSAAVSPVLDQLTLAPELRDAFAAGAIKLSPDVAITVVAAGEIWLVQDGGRVWQIAAPVGGAGLRLAIRATTLYEVLARAEVSHPKKPERATWTLRNGDEVLTVTKPDGAIWYQRARPDAPVVSEIATIARITVDPVADVTAVVLTTPLQHLYDAASCRVCGNVVAMTHGLTVGGEVFGGGVAGQGYTLQHAPLTWLRDAADFEVRCELQVTVNGPGNRALRFGGGLSADNAPGEIWTRIRSLALAGPAERVYALTTDDAQRSTIDFGDGVHGARPPSGSNNLTASYRTGAGASGNVPADALKFLRKRPAGIRSVTNPVAATGGRDAESDGALRLRIPRKFDCCDRIVTLDDYRSFALGLPGVGHAQVNLIPPGIVCLTIMPPDWRPGPEMPELLASACRAIEAHRADRFELCVAGPRVVAVEVALTVAVDRGADPVAVRRRVRAALAASFGHAARAFGQSFDPAGVVEVARVAQGVAGADLTALHRTGEPVGPVGRLIAAPAAYDVFTGEIDPVEWLVIADESAIRVTVSDA